MDPDKSPSIRRKQIAATGDRLQVSLKKPIYRAPGASEFQHKICTVIKTRTHTHAHTKTKASNVTGKKPQVSDEADQFIASLAKGFKWLTNNDRVRMIHLRVIEMEKLKGAKSEHHQSFDRKTVQLGP